MCLSRIAFRQGWYQSRHALHIRPILLTESFEKPPLFDAHTEQEIKVGQHRYQEAVDGNIRIKSKDNDARQVHGVAHDPIDTGRDEFLVRQPLHVPCNFSPRKIPPYLFEAHELPHIEIFKSKSAECKARKLYEMKHPAKPQGSLPQDPVRDLPDEIDGYSSSDRAHSVVEKPVPDPHESISERPFTDLFEPSGNRNAVDKREYEKNYDDFDHGIGSRKYGSDIAHSKLRGGVFSTYLLPCHQLGRSPLDMVHPVISCNKDIGLFKKIENIGTIKG